MKALELTIEQGNKLNEMCKKLFPKYSFGILDIHNSLSGGIIHIYLNTHSEIHWFEGCWQILNEIISILPKSPVKSVEIITNFGIVCSNSSSFIHPIDYLYDLFTSLPIKLNYGYNQRKQANYGERKYHRL